MTNQSNPQNNRFSAKKIAMIGAFAALAYIGFQFFRIDVPVGPAKTAFHFGNVFIMVAAIFLGGPEGGLSGAIGMTIADLTSGYATSAPATFLLKLGIGLVVGWTAKKLKVNGETDPQKWFFKVLGATAAGSVFNLLADPLVRYLINKALYGLEADIAAKFAALASVTTLVNGVMACVVGTLICTALRPSMKRMNL